MNTTYITKIETVNTGGNCMVDLLTLSDGRVIGINDECVALYESMDTFDSGDSIEAFYMPVN